MYIEELESDKRGFKRESSSPLGVDSNGLFGMIISLTRGIEPRTESLDGCGASFSSASALLLRRKIFILLKLLSTRSVGKAFNVSISPLSHDIRFVFFVDCRDNEGRGDDRK